MLTCFGIRTLSLPVLIERSWIERDAGVCIHVVRNISCVQCATACMDKHKHGNTHRHRGGSRGANPAMPPIEVDNGVWPPSRAERVMIVLWICGKVRVLAPLSMSATDLPPTEKYHNFIKTWKRSMTKKRSSEILGDRWQFFWGEMQKFFEKRLKKVVTKFRQKFGPPVSEVLDPLVHRHTYAHLPHIYTPTHSHAHIYTQGCMPAYTLYTLIRLKSGVSIWNKISQHFRQSHTLIRIGLLF